jgi:hypothetical protein
MTTQTATFTAESVLANGGEMGASGYKGHFATNCNGLYQYAAIEGYLFGCGFDSASNTWYGYSNLESTQFTDTTQNKLAQTLDKVANYYAKRAA